MINQQEQGTKLSWSKLGYYSSIFLKRLRNATNIVSQGTQSSSRDSSTRPQLQRTSANHSIVTFD
jgi:hypothetical protein